VQYKMWRIGIVASAEERTASQCLQIAAERVSFWAAMRWSTVVHTPAQSYVEMLCMSPLPSGYLVFPMRLLDADVLQRDHAEVMSEGILGEWRFEDDRRDGRPRLQLIRACDSPLQFLSLCQSERHHPAWLWPAYDNLQKLRRPIE